MNTPPAHNPNFLLPKEIAEIERLRKEGKSIKAIGKAIHRSDKTVAAYLRPIEEKMRKHKHNKRLFNEFTKYTCADTLSVCNDFIAIFNKGICEQEELFDSKLTKKELQKKFKAILDEMRDAFANAAMNVAILAFWTMPAKYKKLWLYMAGEEPTLPEVCKSKSDTKAK